MYYYLFLLLAEAWVVPHPMQIFRGFWGEASPFPSGYATVSITTAGSEVGLGPIRELFAVELWRGVGREAQEACAHHEGSLLSTIMNETVGRERFNSKF